MANVAFAQNKAHDAKFQWITGEPMVYQNWYPGQPDNKADQDKTEYFGEFYNHQRGEWNDESNTVSRSGLYERNTSPPKDSKLIWFQWAKSDGGNGHWYAVNETSAVWTTHMDLAESMNAHLATMNSGEENTFVQGKIIGQNGLWFGLHRSDAPIKKKKSQPEPPPGGYERENYTGRPLGSPPQFGRTSPTKSEPQQAQGNPTRMNLRIRNW